MEDINFDSTIKTLDLSKLYGSKIKKDYSSLSFFDSLLASRYSSNVFEYKKNYKIMINKTYSPFYCFCYQLTSLPEKNLIFGVVRSILDFNFVFKLSLKYNSEPNSNIEVDTCYKFIESNEERFIDQITPVCVDNSIFLYKLDTNFKSQKNKLSLLTSYDYENKSKLFCALDKEYFCFEFYNNKALLGGVNQVTLFNTSLESCYFRRALTFDLTGSSSISSIKVNKSEQKAFCSSNKGFVNVIDLVNNQKAETYNLFCKNIFDLQIYDENSLIVSAEKDNLFLVDLRYVNEKSYLVKYKEHKNYFSKIGFSIDHNYNTITTCGDDKTIKIWSINSGKLLKLISSEFIATTYQNNSFYETFLSDHNYHQLNKITLREKKNFEKSFQKSDSYQVISSSNWNFTPKQPKKLMVGSCCNSIDMFY